MEGKLKDIFNVPNVITYFRIICIPVFVTLMLMGYRWSGLLVFACAAISDLVDGKIARKYNLITNIGTSLDPLADKLMHISVLVTLSIIGNVHWAITILLFAKEIVMVVCTGLLNKKGIFVKADMLGKVASATISVAIILAFFHNAMAPFDTVLLSIGVVLTYSALINYSFIWKKRLAEYKSAQGKGNNK